MYDYYGDPSPDRPRRKRFLLITVIAAMALVLGGGAAFGVTKYLSLEHRLALVTAPTPNPAKPVKAPAPQPVTPAPPSPVSTQATLSDTCTMGWTSPVIQGGYAEGGTYGNFTPGHGPRHVRIQGSSYETALAYQLTLTNDSANTAQVSGFAVVFYDSTGTELGSDTETTQPTFITPGQSLNWTEIAGGTQISGYGTQGNANVPANSATCQLVSWYHS